ncbi:MAG: DUF3567 family protein [Betaproteobacteria bacterium]|nr:DUF3567 family protein [Betaproteobacteria bacterium]
MNVLYDSQNYYVAEYPEHHGIELVDKASGRGAYLEGEVETSFRSSIVRLISNDPGDESVDEFLGRYDALMTNPLVLH